MQVTNVPVAGVSIRAVARFAILLLLFATFAACRPPEEATGGQATTASGRSVVLELDGEPRVGMVPVRVSIDGEGVSGAHVHIHGDMNHAGMVPVLRDAVEQAPGVYVAEDFELTMGGDWIIMAQVELADGESIEVTRFYTVGR